MRSRIIFSYKLLKSKVPDKRSTIKHIMKSRWISSYFDVPQTPLPSLDILKEDKDLMQVMQQNFGEALDEMRINWDSKVKIKELKIVNNPLFERRMKKTKPGEGGADNNQTATVSSSTIISAQAPTISGHRTHFNNEMIVEEYSREDTMIITPTNSRQASPSRK